MSFIKQYKVRFSDTDPAGVMYYPRFLDRFHSVFEDWFDEALKMPYRWVLEETRVGFPTVHTECDYRAPCRFGETLEVELILCRLGTRSFACTYKVRSDGDRKVRVQATVVTATVNLDTFEPIPIPERLRRQLALRPEPPVREVEAGQLAAVSGD